jgi:hypothetical protein
MLVIAAGRSVSAADFAFVQKDSPLQIIGARADLKESYNRVTVINVSSQTILRAQFGWTLSDQEKQMQVAAIGYGPPVDLNLPPLEIARVGAQGATHSIITEKMRAVQTKHVELTLGVIYVKFQDGTEWRYPVAERKGFIQVDDPALLQRIRPKVQEFRANNGLLGKSSKACPIGVKASSTPPMGLLARIAKAFESFNLFNPPAVHADYPWTFVCDPATRHCANDTNQCETFFCDVPPTVCNLQRCCLLNLQTGEKIC